MERRSFSYSGHIPERRSGRDRRRSADRRLKRKFVIKTPDEKRIDADRRAP